MDLLVVIILNQEVMYKDKVVNQEVMYQDKVVKQATIEDYLEEKVVNQEKVVNLVVIVNQEQVVNQAVMHKLQEKMLKLVLFTKCFMVYQI